LSHESELDRLKNLRGPLPADLAAGRADAAGKADVEAKKFEDLRQLKDLELPLSIKLRRDLVHARDIPLINALLGLAALVFPSGRMGDRMPAPPFWLAPLAGVSRNGATREDYLELFGWGHRYRWVQWQAGLAAGVLILGETVTLFYPLRINLASLQAHNNSGPSPAASVTRSILTLE
jgi:hypothetical protein